MLPISWVRATCRIFLVLLFCAGPALAAELKLRGEYVLAPPEFRLDVWKALIDRFAAEGKNFIYWWGSSFFHSKRYPDAIFFRERKGNYLSHDEIRELIRYAQSRGIKFYMAVGGFGWLTINTLAELYPETHAKGSSGMCPNNPRAHEINIGWIEELYQTFPQLDGIMVELRDEAGPCNCEICQRRIDKYGSQQYGQGELKFLRDLSQRIWKVQPKAEIVVCIGYGEHRAHVNDVAFYEGIRALGKDLRWIWLEVRDHWKLPAAGGVLQPLRYFSPRVVSWYQPEWHTAGELAAWVRKAAAEQLEGVCLGREKGSWTLLYHIREGNPYLAHTLRKDLSHFTFSTLGRNPELTPAEFEKLAAEEFFGPVAGARESAALLYLDDLLLRIGRGLGPAGNYYAPNAASLRTLLQRAADPARADSLKQAEWNEVFARTRAIQRAAALEGDRVRSIAALLAGISARVPKEKSDRFGLVQEEVQYLQQLLGVEESGAVLLAKAHSRAAEHVSPLRQRIVATSEWAATPWGAIDEYTMSHAAINLFDGNPKTNWSCGNAVPLPQSVAVEFPAARPVERVTLSQSSHRLDMNTRRYRIEGSLNGYDFETLAEGELPLELGASRSHEIGGRLARFVRIVVLSIYPDAAYSSPALSEVEIIAGGKSVREWLQQ